MEFFALLASLIDFKETAHLLGDISERSVRRLIASGQLPQPVKVLSAPRLYHSEVKAYSERLKNKRLPGNARFMRLSGNLF